MVSVPLLGATPPLIPRTVVLEASERGNPVLSPDGKRVAYTAPLKGVANIWIRTLATRDERPATADTKDGIDSCYWQADGQHVLYLQDRSGDEDTHLYQTNTDTGATRDLTPLAGARAMGLIMDPRHPDTLLIHMNARDKRFFDLYRLDLKTGILKLDTQNPGDVARFYADHRLRVRAAEVIKRDNSVEIMVRDDSGAPWRTLMAWGSDEMNSDLTGVAGFSADDSRIWVVTSVGANTERLLEVDLRTGARNVLGEDPQFDVSALMVNPIRGTLDAVGVERERMSWTFFDKRTHADFDVLGKVRSGDIWIRGRDRSDRVWLVKYTASDYPTTYYLYDRTAKTAAYLFSEDPKLEQVRLARKRPIEFKASDGMTIYGYLTVPVGGPSKGIPLVVLVHGGPWTRDDWSLDLRVQCLSNRGYAVLQVNFRGSTGYGKAYENAGDLKWGSRVIQDLVDGKNWVVAQGVADPKRVAIMGGSFGGYATLAALAFYPREFTCGVAINAVSDANRLMASMPSHWTVGRARFETRMGKDPEFLKSISPLGKADRVVRPLLIMHNANDVRVKQEHSDLMVAALRRSGKDVTYLVFPNAGHVSGGAPADFFTRWAAVEAFLGRHLGGRVEPPGEAEKWEHLLK